MKKIKEAMRLFGTTDLVRLKKLMNNWSRRGYLKNSNGVS